jgi:hypothetical protein
MSYYASAKASGIAFVWNHILGAPDSVVASTNLASVVYLENLYHATSLPHTSGFTTQISPGTSIDIQGVHTVGLNPSQTPITSIVSSLGPGEMVTFFTLYGGSATFQAGGNVDLMGMTSLTVNGTVTFVRTDLSGPLWKVVSQWTTTMAPSNRARNQGVTDPLIDSNSCTSGQVFKPIYS